MILCYSSAIFVVQLCIVAIRDIYDHIDKKKNMKEKEKKNQKKKEEEVREGEMNIFLKLLKYILFKFALVSFHWILVQA